MKGNKNEGKMNGRRSVMNDKRKEIMRVFDDNAHAFAELIDTLLISKDLRERFKKDPVDTLEYMGFELKQPDKIKELIDEYREEHTILEPGSDVMCVMPAPGVANTPVAEVAVGVAVGVIVAVNSRDKYFDKMDIQKVESIKNIKRIAVLESRIKELEEEIARGGSR